MRAPFHGQLAEDERRPAQVARTRYYLRRLPVMRLHDPRGVACILNRVPRLWLDEESGIRHTLRVRGPRHYLGLDIVVGDRSARDNQPWRNPAFVLMNGFSYPGQLIGGWIAVPVGRSAKHDDCVKSR